MLKLFVERNPADFAAREALAIGLVDLRQFSNARFQLSRMLAERNNLPAEQVGRIQANIGLSWFLEGRVENAKNALRKAIETSPNVSPIAYENLARLYMSQEEFGAARDILIQALRVFPDRTATAVLLSHLYSLLGEVERSIEGLEAFKSRSDAPMELYVLLSFFYTLNGKLEQSVEVAKDGLKKFSHSPMLINNLAYVYAMTDRIEEARLALRMLPKESALHVELIATKGLLRLREGDEKQGVELYEQAEHMATELGNKELARRVRQKKHLELARFLVRKNLFDKARTEIKHGLAIRVKRFSYEKDLWRLAKGLDSEVVN
jgi:tetratricopeptide (TPR) repeat protein